MRRAPVHGKLTCLAAGLSSFLAACVADPVDAPHPHDMPETAAPVVQDTERGPVDEGAFDAAAIASSWARTDGGLVSGVIALSGPGARAAVWLELHEDTAPTPRLSAQAGWSNGEVGPWTPLELVWGEAGSRLLAANLDTAATRIQLRIERDEAAVREMRWAVAVPLSDAARTDARPEPNPLAGVGARATYEARPARCGAPAASVQQVVLHLEPAGVGDEAPLRFLRARQALDLDGLRWCDARPNYVVGAGEARAARGARVGAIAPAVADNATRVSVAVLGCDAPTSTGQAGLTALLDALTVAHGLSSAAQFTVAPSALCPSPSPWLAQALEGWLATAPFVVEPPPPPPPPPETGGLAGQVVRAEDGAPIEGATVACPCGADRQTDASGGFEWSDVPPGTHRVTVTALGFEPGAAEATVVIDETAQVEVRLQPEPPNPGVSVIDHAFLIDHFGGTNVDPTPFPETQDGFQSYLDAVGVTYFAAWEYVVPNNEAVAQRCGYTILLPPRSEWPKAAALGLLADRLRALVAEPVTLRNWWRPDCYNVGVGGAAGGDHPDADALDLDFRSATSRAAAQRYLCETYWLQDIVAPEDIAPGSGLNPRLNMSIGLGGATIHLGLLSRNGRRFWRYSSYSNEPNSGSCW